jgi:hypothetical protein
MSLDSDKTASDKPGAIQYSEHARIEHKLLHQLDCLEAMSYNRTDLPPVQRTINYGEGL